MNFHRMRTASRALPAATAPGATPTTHAQSFVKSLTIESISKRLFSLGLLCFAVGSLAVSNTASAQGQVGVATSPFQLVNYETGLCLAVSNNSITPGAQIETWACNGTPSQLWFQGDPTVPGSVGQQAYTLDSMVIDCRGCAFLVAGVQGGIIQDAQPVITWTEDPNPTSLQVVNNQGWAFSPLTSQNGHQCYQILNAGIQRQTPYNLGVQGGSRAEGTPAVIWQDLDSVWNHPDQIWCVVYP